MINSEVELWKKSGREAEYWAREMSLEIDRMIYGGILGLSASIEKMLELKVKFDASIKAPPNE